jgi:tetratricopeptide (TPR) repeat protein
MLRRWAVLIAALIGMAPAAARAEWKEATSTHFQVYSEGSEAQLREFASKLEKYNYVLRLYHKVTAPPSPIKLKVYLLPSIPAVGKMAGSDGVAGYYVPDARGLMMVGTRTGASNRSSDIRTVKHDVEFDSESILLHEYAHHFMYQYFPATYPTWYSEGFAEFWGATRFLPDNVVEVGRPVNYRFGSFFSNRWLPVAKLLTAQSYRDVPEIDLLYAEGWLLVRLAFEKAERSRQLHAYLAAINGGATYEEAMNRSFGDVRTLNSELHEYAGASRFNVLRLPFKPIPVGDIAVRAVTPAEDALMAYAIRLGQGIRQRDAADFAARLRGVAARFADDPHALNLLAEAERLAGNREAAAAALDRLLAVAPNDSRGLMQKGVLELAGLKAAASTDAKAWAQARTYLERAGKIAPKDPLILQAFHESYRSQGVLPPDSAQNALYSAMELAPSDDELRYQVAADFEQRDMIEEALAIIRPLAFTLPPKESDKQKREREKLEDKYRQAGRDKRETARDMFLRLQKKLEERKAARGA